MVGGLGKRKRVTREAFQILTTTLLSLLPLSILLLACLSTAHYLLSISDTRPHPTSFLCSLFLYTKTPTILRLLVSVISVSSLTHALSTGGGKTTFLPAPSEHLTRPRLYIAWIFLCTLQVCVGLGIDCSISAGIGFGQERSFLISRVIFFFGLHETMLFWGRMVVKPVVNDTLFGFWRKEEGWAEKLALTRRTRRREEGPNDDKI